MFGNFRVGFHGELCNVGIGKGQAFYVTDVSIQHHLIDVAGGNHLLIDYRTDVEALCHTYIIYIFYFRHCLADAHTFGGKAGKNVCFRVFRQGYEGFCVLQTFFDKQAHIASVPVDNHNLIVKKFCQAVATVQVIVYDLHLHIVGYILGGSHGNTASTHDHYVAYVGIIFLSGYLTYIRYILAGSGEVNDVMQFDYIVTARNQCFVAAFDGYYVIGLVCFGQLVQRNIQYFRFFTHLGTDKYQRSATEFPPLAHPTHTYGRYDFFSGKHFRVNQ